MKNPVFKKCIFLIVPVLFLLYSAPGALSYVFYFPDEKYYTDAVLTMMEKGDYFTPYNADGSPRFFKPIITYWVLMKSYLLFGVSPLTSRLLFWMAGALLVTVTFLMAKSITGNKKTALTAAFITASNPLVLLSSSRSIPDILLTLFLTISAWGFLLILISEKQKKIHLWMAYLGAALAFETKGVPAAAFAGLSMLYLVLNPWKKINLKLLFEPYSIVVSVLIALSWFIVMYFIHGTTYLESFFEDQIGGRVSSKTMQVLNNTGLGIINLIAFSIPWIIIAFSKPRELKTYIAHSDKVKKSVFGFIVMWILLIILMAGAVFKFYDRYILPVIPLISILFASIFTDSNTGFRKSVISILLLLNFLFLTILLIYSVFIFSTPVLLFGIIVCLITITLYLFGVFKNVPSENVIASGILLLYFSAFVLLHPLLLPNSGKQLAQKLTEQGISENNKVYVYGNIRTASNIRISSNNKIDVITMDTLYNLPENPNHFLVFDKKEKNMPDLANYEIVTGSEEWLRVPVSKFPLFLQKPVQKLKENSTTYMIAKPKLK